MNKTELAIQKLENQINSINLKHLQKEADLREYTDKEYLDYLQFYIKQQPI